RDAVVQTEDTDPHVQHQDRVEQFGIAGADRLPFARAHRSGQQGTAESQLAVGVGGVRNHHHAVGGIPHVCLIGKEDAGTVVGDVAGRVGDGDVGGIPVPGQVNPGGVGLQRVVHLDLLLAFAAVGL